MDTLDSEREVIVEGENHGRDEQNSKNGYKKTSSKTACIDPLQNSSVVQTQKQRWTSMGGKLANCWLLQSIIADYH